MVRVDQAAADRAMAWRVRDALASHPLLGGCTAEINITATADGVTLTGWIADERLSSVVYRLAVRAAGKRPVHTCLQRALTKNIQGACLSITER